MACRDGSLRHGTLLGARTDEAWARGSADAGEGCEGLRQAQQERCRRRRGDLRGSQAPNHAVRYGQVGRATGPVDAASSTRSADAPTHPVDQCMALIPKLRNHDSCYPALCRDGRIVNVSQIKHLNGRYKFATMSQKGGRGEDEV